MNYNEVMEYVEELKAFGSVPGLDNMENLCQRLEDPQKELKVIHIAGTNGKGSVQAFLTEILRAAGYRVGSYISPTLFDYRERIQINKKPISQKELCRKMEILKGICQKLTAEGKPHPTAFEIETAMALWHFKEKKCDLVVLETGMGGLLDATNIVVQTVVSVFTSISLDHMGVLGKTLGEIAVQKAGIMKPGTRAVALAGEQEVREVLVGKAKELGIPLTWADPSKVSQIRSSLDKQTFSYGELSKLTISMAGRYQIDNSVLAIEAVKALREAGYPISDKAVYEGLQRTIWPGRFQILARKPLFIADGAHNRDGAARLAETIRFYFTNRRILYIIGILRDKEQDQILEAVCPMAEQIFTVPTQGERGLGAYELARMAGRYHASVTALDSVREAVELSYLMADKDTVIIALGSLSYLGELISYVDQLGKERNIDKIIDKVGRDSHGKQRED